METEPKYKCLQADICGYRQWRINPPSSLIIPITDSFCDQNPKECLRINGNDPNIQIKTYGPKTREEIEKGLPLIDGRRLPGGTFK